jgi:type VI protein secretion system component Hcp
MTMAKPYAAKLLQGHAGCHCLIGYEQRKIATAKAAQAATGRHRQLYAIPGAERCMPEIVLMVPSPTGYSASAQQSAMAKLAQGKSPGKLPWLEGECRQMDYYKMLLVETVGWDVTVSEASGSSQRRTTHMPEIETISLERRIDVASATLKRWTVNSYVSTDPWEIYFLRSMGSPDEGPTRVCFMTVQLYNPLITKYEFNAGSGSFTESLEVSATKIKWTYNQINDRQQSMGKKIVTYDLQTGMVG